MKILVNPDSVPINLDECLNNIKFYLDREDIEQLQHYDHNPFLDDKVGAASFLEEKWSLNDKKTRLVEWFKSTYKINKSTIISEIILDCLFCDIKGYDRRDKIIAKKFAPKKKREVKHE